MAGKRKEKGEIKNLNINGFPIKYKNKMFGSYLCREKKVIGCQEKPKRFCRAHKGCTILRHKMLL